MVLGGMDENTRPMVGGAGCGRAGKEILCLLWMGFRDELMLPESEVAARGLTATGTRTVQFADGSRITSPTYPVQLLLAGEAHDVEALAWHGEPRLGMALFQGYRLSMKFTQGGTITMEKL